MENTTDEQVLKLRYKTFIPMLIAIIVGTNTATSLILRVGENTDQIEYNSKRTNRKTEDVLSNSKLYTDVRFYELRIKELEEQLKEFKDAR